MVIALRGVSLPVNQNNVYFNINIADSFNILQSYQELSLIYTETTYFCIINVYLC